ncbi:hypothetical protein [Hyalangium versicolor]|uniref:hypothetical protein n=1 Tax=Hyalangium versicolor TaxID=2861190 RepID=UPI001CCEB7FC|nr:hypothetical protein [Hyalangium versicolor]
MKRHLKDSLRANKTLTYAALSDAAYSYDVASGHATGVALFEAMLEVLAEGHVLSLEGFPAPGAPQQIRTAHELEQVVERHFPYVSLRDDFGRYFG